ncbi:MAG: hypothetical protein AAFS10_16320 [Myxococcota bacterium]
MSHRTSWLFALSSSVLLVIAPLTGCGDESDDDSSSAEGSDDSNSHSHGDSNGHNHDHSNGHGHSNDTSHSNGHDHSNGTSHSNNTNALTGEAATMACTMATNAGTALTAADSMDTLGDAMVMTNGGPTTITLPAGGTGYVSLMAESAHSDIMIFVGSADVLSKWVYEDQDQSLGTPQINGECSDDIPAVYMIHMHETLNAVLELNGSSDVWIMAMSGSSGHGHEGHEDHGN